MRDDMSAIEVQPYGFAGLWDGNWANTFFRPLAARANHRVHYYAITISDALLSRPGKWETLGITAEQLNIRDRCAPSFDVPIVSERQY
jgi:hypothetical protein